MHLSCYLRCIGSAAIHSVKGRENIHCFVLYPTGRISLTQERQMTTVLDKNIHVVAVSGTTSDGLDEVWHCCMNKCLQYADNEESFR